MTNPFAKVKKVLSDACVDLGGPEACIFLVASGRSGTTWVGDFLSHVFRFRFVFEPFWHLHYAEDGTADFFHHRYIAPEDGRWDAKLRGVVDGSARPSTGNYNGKIGFCHGRVVKDICANLFIPRLHAIAPRMPVIYLVRHPCAVALSRRRKGEFTGEWGRHAPLFLNQPALLEAVGEPLRAFAGRELTEHEDYALSTCMENYFLHRLRGEPYIHRIFYEELVLDFAGTMRKAIGFVQEYAGFSIRKPMERIKNYYLLSHPDSTKAMNEDPRKHLLSWREKLTPEEIRTVVEMNDAFGLDYYREIEAVCGR